MKIKAAVLRETGGPLLIETVELASPKPNEVLVQIVSAGVCHSDLHAINSSNTPKPIVLGHEGAGIVVQTGNNVKHVKEGDKVTLNWIPYCGTCKYCKNGEVHLCESAIGPMEKGLLPDGTSRLSKNGESIFHDSCLAAFAEYVVVDAMSCVKLPDEMPLEKAALLGCGVATGFGAAVNAGEVRPGSTVAVFGCGGVGVNAIQGARIAGASQIIAIDMKKQNLEYLTKFGATHTICISEVSNLEETIMALTDGYGVDVSIDTTGYTNATANAYNVTRKGGIVVVVGFYQEEILTLPATLFHRRGKTIKGCCYGNINPHKDIELLAKLYLDGKLMLDELVLKRINLEDINSVFESFKDHKTMNTGRSVINFLPQSSENNTPDSLQRTV